MMTSASACVDIYCNYALNNILSITAWFTYKMYLWHCVKLYTGVA